MYIYTVYVLIRKPNNLQGYENSMLFFMLDVNPYYYQKDETHLSAKEEINSA